MRLMYGARGVVTVMAAMAAVACGGDDGSAPPPPPPPPPVRGVRILSGADVTDSAGARMLQPLIVEVHDSAGALAPLGTVVRFESLARAESYEARVASLTALGYSSLASGITDASGRTGVLVELGERPGTARVAIVVPTLGVRDTARFTVTPAAPARITLTPSDTAVFVGGSFTVRGSVTDRYDNPRSDPIALSIARTGASVTSGGVVSTSAVGRYTIQATVGPFSQTAQFSVVPPGLLTAFDVISGEIVTVDLVGGNQLRRALAVSAGIGIRPKWVAGTGEVIYSTFNGQLQELELAAPNQGTRLLFPQRPASITHAADPAPSANGAWVYFAAHSAGCASDDYCLHRARLDGTGIEIMEATRVFPERSFRPSPSPDGRRVAFQVDVSTGPRVRVLDAETQQLSAWSEPGFAPAWSPNGQMIAYMNSKGDLNVIGADGSSPRVVVAGKEFLRYDGITWSPDSQWIMYRVLEGTSIVNAQTGEVLPIPRLNAYFNVNWR
jgi:hypothetical protein